MPVAIWHEADGNIGDFALRRLPRPRDARTHSGQSLARMLEKDVSVRRAPSSVAV